MDKRFLDNWIGERGILGKKEQGYPRFNVLKDFFSERKEKTSCRDLMFYLLSKAEEENDLAEREKYMIMAGQLRTILDNQISESRNDEVLNYFSKMMNRYDDKSSLKAETFVKFLEQEESEKSKSKDYEIETMQKITEGGTTSKQIFQMDTGLRKKSSSKKKITKKPENKDNKEQFRQLIKPQKVEDAVSIPQKRGPSVMRKVVVGVAKWGTIAGATGGGGLLLMVAGKGNEASEPIASILISTIKFLT
jgi:hypothetical protein